ncbi:hypothetical protein GGR53DRAFT_471632 [Hypoxylon sp. FL1150]|nr:hypothetical protein GGR53DRAFT_471632 [Hypoxylon sp. FL1150]
MTKTGIEYQVYKFKFSNGKSIRNSLFKELNSLNKRLEQLMSISDKEAQLMEDRQNQRAYICDGLCYIQHSTRLLLQHRDTKKSEFNVFFARPEDSGWKIQETKISEDGDPVFELAKDEMMLPKKSAMRPKVKTTPRPTPSVTLMACPATLSVPAVKPIANLCVSLADSTASCYGFLPHDDCRYYVYKVPRQDTKALDSITLDQVLRGRVSKPPNRRQRLALSFILSSSFLQLLSTPWLTGSWVKADIMFMSDPNEPGVYALDRPHLYRNLAEKDCQKQSDENITNALRRLGIVLLELCFGRLLEDHPCRKKWASVNDENLRFALDVAAALDWLQEVEGEVGPDYASAVGWCLLATRPDRWRQDMLRKVVKPLEGCHQCLVSQGNL